VCGVRLAWPISRHYVIICLERLGDVTKPHDNHQSILNLKQIHLEYKSVLLPVHSPAQLKITFGLQYPECGCYGLFCVWVSFMTVRERAAFII
jgi:hypothetical protein